MSSKYWIRLYHEMLDDPKVARLNDSTYRRFIECMLLAGEMHKRGLLPPIEDMAWRLRLSETALAQDLSRLALAGLVELITHDDNERWLVTNFAKRQAPMSKAEYMQRKRDEDKKAEYYQDRYQNRYQDVTNSNTDKDKDKDKDKIKNKDKDKNALTLDDGYGSCISAYENNIAPITPIMSETIQTAYDEFGADDIVEAISLAVKADVRKWSYVNGILKKWRKNGKFERKAEADDPLGEQLAGTW